ncbi:DUF6069 family protein [Nocardioides renjunii]|uniref:DUF6069 family protein n=1 Tax=Nocardioides renjunii TaxID=3095075 RepID=UPI002AFF4857|nr:DUF6069 family protein [Nocardioides sp. S-34]WQQ22769.1 DUF6069 family protein [Nocardioides sp. S-34]
MRRAGVVLAAVLTAVVVNPAAYALGRLAGGDFTFTREGEAMTVDAVTVAGFSAVPLGLGLTVVALLVGRVPRIATVASVVAAALAVATIGLMTLPVDLDAVSTVALAACHLTLVPISLVAIRRLNAAAASEAHSRPAASAGTGRPAW